MNDLKKPVSIYTITAQLFAAVAKEVAKEFGKEGEEAVRRGVRAFGERRGRHIAANAAADGKQNTLENYLPYYDMERSDLFVYDTELGPNCIDQHFHVCPFAQAWLEDNDSEIGKLYCDEIDASIARGFNPEMKHICHTHLLYGSDCCHMSFEMDQKTVGNE